MARRRSRSSDRGDELREVVHRFIRAFGLLEADQTPCGKPVSTSYAHALMTLLDREAPISQRELGRSLGIDKSNVTRLCRRMEAAGHATVSRSPADGRVRQVELTAGGQRLAREIGDASRARFSSLLDAVPPNKRDALLQSLDLLATAVQSLRPPTD